MRSRFVGMSMRARAAGAAVAVLAMLGGSTLSASAHDGIMEFFQQQFGGGAPEPQQALPQPDYGYGAPPLTVRKSQHRRPSESHRSVARGGRSSRYSVADLKGVTIYTDRTLAPGDAVMTKDGLRVFNGSPSMPHTDADFVALSATSRLPAGMRKELHAIDVASRSDPRF